MILPIPIALASGPELPLPFVLSCLTVAEAHAESSTTSSDSSEQSLPPPTPSRPVTPPPRPEPHHAARVIIFSRPGFVGKQSSLGQGAFSLGGSVAADFSVRLARGLQIAFFVDDRCAGDSPLGPGTYPPSVLGFSPIASIDVSPGFTVHAHMANGVVDSASEPRPDIDWRSIRSLAVLPICPRGCNGGRCIGPARCACLDGWIGDDCSSRAVDATSRVVCPLLTLRAGSRVWCSIQPRFRDASVTGVAGLAAAFVATNIATGERLVIDDTARFAFDVVGPPLPSSSPRELIRVVVAATGHILSVPHFAVVGTPDATSTVACNHSLPLSLLPGSSVDCELRARQADDAIMARSSDFALAVDTGCLAATPITPLRTARMPGRAQLASTFRFRLIAKHTPASQDCPWSVTLADATTRLHTPHVSIYLPLATDHLGQASLALYAGNLRAAARHASQAVAHTGDTAAVMLHADILLRLGEFSSAHAEYEALLDARGSSLSRPARRLLRLALYRAAKLARSVATVRKLLAANSDINSSAAINKAIRALELIQPAADLARCAPDVLLLRAQAALVVDAYALVKYDASVILATDGATPYQVGSAILTLARSLLRTAGHVDGAAANFRACARARYGAATAEACANGTALVVRLRSAAAAPAACLAEPGCSLAESDALVFAAASLQSACLAATDHQPDADTLCNAALDYDDRLRKRRRRLRKVHGAPDATSDAAVAMVIHLGRLALTRGELDKAMVLLRRVANLAPGDPRVNELQKAIIAARDAAAAEEQAEVGDYYEILGVARNATTKQIKAAYRRRARELHPDRNSAPDADEMFMRLAEAYAVLSDPETRARYDAGQDVSSTHRASGGVKFHFDKEAMANRKPGEKVKAWFGFAA
ncbi:uncharacterized protein AMSG_06061 [Thecamonas trahens ATCC 50062]|uniref:J domain-containing protein n=1 Tax=Thecamonas trahens ATCC 50062 TaxID=461836 RepID=A0A0L0DEM8_THETB|nr:hypothetical protein AMSG_06061 [Thecamonas trahens ATCC 50062]KNC49783.1 hypothetical protein AMSG_06061 [Thecamonas trahens ATCC 50062]|eukprot:XP_013757567.1 hypothetical protein AMSG_06061 [Thecamonas trahens ATCC 50062]